MHQLLSKAATEQFTADTSDVVTSRVRVTQSFKIRQAQGNIVLDV